MARPLKELNWDIVKKKMQAGCSAKEICGNICDINTFYRRFKKEFGCRFEDYAYVEAESGAGDIKLMQHVKAMQGNWSALQWLGKVRLGQKEPETVQYLAANQSQIDQSHIIMELQHQVVQLKELLEANANKPQTE